MSEISRRTFIQLSVTSTALAAGLAGCKNQAIWQEEATGQYGGTSNKVYPYVNQPAAELDGVPTYFATTCQMCAAGCGIYVRTLGGRAKKIEGNPYHPVSGGKSCLRGQLALQHLYNPDRLMNPKSRLVRSGDLADVDWEDALARTATALTATRGKTAILIDGATIARSPTKMYVLEKIRQKLHARIVQFSLFDDAPNRASAQTIYGRNQLPDYRLDLADVIISFGANFLETWPSPVYYGRLFGEFRQGPTRRIGDHGTFVYVGPRLSMTAAKADVWLPCRSGSESDVANAIVQYLGGSGISIQQASDSSGLSVQQIVDLAALVKGAGSRSVAIGGEGLFSSRSVTRSYEAVDRINSLTSSECVRFGSAALVTVDCERGFHAVQDLLGEMSNGQIGALLFIGPVNPAFTLPAAEGWNDAVSRVPFVASLGSFLDETSSNADVVLPTRTFLEEWCDHEPSVLPTGFRMASMSQPVIDPTYITRRHAIDSDNQPKSLMDTREMLSVLLDLAGRVGIRDVSQTGIDEMRKAWSGIVSANVETADFNNDPKWVDAVSSGGVWQEVSQTMPLAAAPGQTGAFATATPNQPDGNFALLLYPHIYHDDGRHANLGWAQEMPDPMNSAVWNNWIEINPAVAHELGIRTGDIVRITSSTGFVEVPAIPFPGIRPDVVAMPIGQGHSTYGRNASGIGENPLAILESIVDAASGALAYSATMVTLEKVRSARVGYQADSNTLVLVQDRPGGAEPPAVKDLIHETARQWSERFKHPSTQPSTIATNKPVI